MSSSISLRSWATPLTIGSFLVMGATGILMFFHVETGLNGFLHEWAGWAMVLGVSAHLALNWRPFKSYLKRPTARAFLGGSALLLLFSFWPAGEGGGNIQQKVFESLTTAEIETVILLSGQELDAGLRSLQAAGLEVTGETSISALAEGHRGEEMRILRLLFAGGA